MKAGSTVEGMNTTNRYNPIKFMRDPKRLLEESNPVEEAGNEDGSTGGNMQPFFNNSMSVTKREQYVPQNVPVMIPE